MHNPESNPKKPISRQSTRRMSAVQDPIIPIVAQLIADHPGTISLGQGVVRYGPPAEAFESLTAGMADLHQHKYQPVTGIAPLRERIAAKLAGENAINADRSAIVITAGSNMGFMNAVLAIADHPSHPTHDRPDQPADEVIIQSPYYFNHEMALAICGVKAVVVPTTSDYQLDVMAIEAAITERTRAVVTISPNNPTGAVYAEEALTRVNAICRERGVYHISDEAYEYFVYGDEPHFSPGSLPGAEDHTISLFSLSKAYGFASWRVGYMVLPEHLEPAVHKIQDTNLICPPVVSQHAAAGALEVGRAYCEPYLKELAHVRRLVLDELASLGDLVTLPTPGGAFYALIQLHTEMQDMAIVDQLVKEHGVAVIPGCAFGLHEGCFLRIAYGALDEATVKEGMGRLVKGLREILPG
ncbi:MAG: pyridoxal phosphate-dependent aminotransferase [Planctomycetota bacterium]|jgi:aspartate/methionine/tyrosine aminotransferase